MDIAEVKEKRDLLKQQICALICEFNAQTGCCVEDVKIRYTNTIGQPRATFLNVNLNVSINHESY